MTHQLERHHRRSIRLQDYDYTQAGAYFVTICTHNRECLFGEIVDGQIRLNDMGKTAEQCWLAIPEHFPHVALDELVVMPNHLHGIIVLPVGARHASPLPIHAPPLPIHTSPLPIHASPLPIHTSPLPVHALSVGARHASPLQSAPRGQKKGAVAAIVGSFKSAATKRINELRATPGCPLWQRNYYEHVIRNEASLAGIREYIAHNPLQWEMDRENPESNTYRKAQGKK